MALWLLVMVSALSVIAMTHKNRNVFIVWQALIEESYQLDVEWGQLLLEKNTLASYSRLQSIAGGQLDMIEPSGKRLQVISEK